MKAVLSSTVDMAKGFFGGIAKYEHAVTRALTANDVSVERRFIDTRDGSTSGAYIMPIWKQATGRVVHFDGEIIHAIQPKTALRGTDVVSIHSPMLDKPRYLDPRDWVWRLLNHQAFRNAKLYTVNTTWDPRMIAMRYGHKIADRCRPVGMSFDPSYRIDSSVARDIDVLWVGKSTPNKGLRLFHGALIALGKADPTRKTFVQSTLHQGFRAEHEWARQAFGQLPNVIFNDVPIPEKDMARLFQRSKVIVCTSEYETFWQPGMEAYRCGVSVVTPQRPPHVVIYRMGVDGFHNFFHFEPDNVAEAMLEALRQNPNGCTPDPYLIGLYSDESFGKRLVETYEELGRR